MKKLIPLVLLIASGCASDQYLRGEDYTRTEVVVIEPKEKPLLHQLMPHLIWVSMVAGLSYWLWKDYKNSKQ
jgi:hypothetical protein